MCTLAGTRACRRACPRDCNKSIHPTNLRISGLRVKMPIIKNCGRALKRWKNTLWGWQKHFCIYVINKHLQTFLMKPNIRGGKLIRGKVRFLFPMDLIEEFVEVGFISLWIWGRFRLGIDVSLFSWNKFSSLKKSSYFKSMLLLNFLIRWSSNISNLLNISMMLNKWIIQWFSFDFTI